MGEMHPAGPDADEGQILDALVAFQNLVRDTGQRPGDVAGVHHELFILPCGTHHHSISNLGCSKRLSSKAAGSEGPRRTLWGTLRA
jgi:hypothetical protein